VVAEGLAGEVTLLADGSIRPSLRGTVLGGPASLAGTAGIAEGGSSSAGTLDLTVRAAPDLAELQSLGVLPDGSTLSGRLEADVRVTGPLSDVGDLRLWGDLAVARLRGTHPELGVPVEIAEGGAALAGTTMTLREMSVALGEDRILVSGELRDLLAFSDPQRTPFLEARVHGPRLSLLRLRAEPPPDTTLTYGRVAFAKVGGRSIQGRTPEEAAREMGLTRPDSLPIAGRLDVRLDTLVDRRGTSTAVQAQVDFGPHYVRVSEATFSRYGGVLSSALDFSMGAGADQPFALRLQVRDVDAGAFLGATTPLGALVHGRITLETELSGSLDALLLPRGPSLVGTGQYIVRDGGLRDTPLTRALATYLDDDDLSSPTIRNWGTSFILTNGILRLADAVVDGAPGTPTVGGGLGLDGSLDLLAAFDFPARQLNAATLDRLGVAGDIAARLQDRDDVVQAVLRLGGSLLDPSVQADPGAPAQTLADAAREETAVEIQRQVDERKRALEDRASGFLRGLLQPRDTTRPPPPDTVAADTIRVDSLMADTLRPDTLRPDTVQKDTMPGH
jgi:hypothetical protein